MKEHLGIYVVNLLLAVGILIMQTYTLRWMRQANKTWKQVFDTQQKTFTALAARVKRLEGERNVPS